VPATANCATAATRRSARSTCACSSTACPSPHRPVLVVDAKYKLAAAQSDLYQILAYCHILGLTTGVLVHPAHEQAPAGALAVRGPGGIYLRYLALDLRGNPAQLQVQVRALAERVWSLLEEKTC